MFNAAVSNVSAFNVKETLGLSSLSKEGFAPDICGLSPGDMLGDIKGDLGVLDWYTISGSPVMSGAVCP